MQTDAQIETAADIAMQRETNTHLDRRYPDEVEVDDTIERLSECAKRCQEWLFAMKLAIELKQECKAWQALEELQCEADQMLEDKP